MDEQNVGWSRTIYDRAKGFLRVGLTLAEKDNLRCQLRVAHQECLKECFEDADFVLRWFFGRSTPANTVRVAMAVFERRAPAAYTVYAEALDRKVFALKNGNGGENHD